MIPFEREPKRDGGREWRALEHRGRGEIDRGVLAARAPSDRARGAARLAGWLIGPLLLASVAAAMLLVLRGPDQLFAIAFGGVLALGLAWILTSALLPGGPDRRCPRCGRTTVARLDARALTGLRCRACSWRDEDASAFLHAEDDGAPLEDLVLRERGRFRRFQ